MDDDAAAVPGQRRESDDDRQRKLTALRARLHEEAQAMRTPEDWAGCLRLAARLPGESFANILLISAQRPGATLLRGYDAWHAMGRQVSRQEKGITVFSAARRPRAAHQDPHTGHEADEPVPTWRDAERVGYVWDLSQTSGDAVSVRAATPSPPGQTPPGPWDALCWMARREGFAVEREHGCPDDGVTMWAARRIRVLTGLDEPRAAWALAHQLGHVLLHEPVGYPPAPPPPAAPEYTRPKPTRWPSSSAPDMTSRPGTGFPALQPGPAVIPAPSRLRPSWPSANALPPRRSPGYCRQTPPDRSARSRGTGRSA